jgi:hypothetical protein
MADSSPGHEMVVQSTTAVFEGAAAAAASVGDDYVTASTIVAGEAAAVTRGPAAAKATVRPGMENLPREVIQKQQQSRIQHLENEIQTFRNNIEKTLRGEL